MYIAICGENTPEDYYLEELLNRYFKFKSQTFELFIFKNAKSLVDEIEDGLYFDLVFLDVYIEGVLGIDVARKLREIGFENGIAFLASTADFAVAGYDVRAVGYLLRPFGYDKVKSVMDRLADKCYFSMYQIKQRKSTFRISYDDITFVESNNSKCTLHTSSGSEYIIYKHLSEIEAELSDMRFLRCHRSYLVNMNYISQVDKQFLLRGGEVVLIRQKSLKEMRERYLEYTEKTTNKPKRTTIDK